MEQIDIKHFVIRRRELSTVKLFAEFYQPKYQNLLDALKRGPYPLRPLAEISVRMFDGPFGSNRKVEMYQESGIPYVRVKDVLPEGINQDGLTYISEEKHKEIIRSRVVPDNVLITIAGRVGTAAVFPPEFPEGNITGHIAGIEVSSGINPHFLAAFINSMFGEFQIECWSHRTTRPELNLFELGKVLISIPPDSLQDRIAHVMRTAYETRRIKLTEARNVLRSIDKHILFELGILLGESQRYKHFTVRSSNVVGQRFDVGPYTNHFNVRKLKSVDTVPLHSLADLPRSTLTPSRTPSDEFMYIGMADVDEVTGEVNARKLLGADINSNKIVIKGGDIVFARIEPCIYNRKIAYIPNEIAEALGSTELLIARPKGKVSPEFLQWMLRSEFIQRQIAGKMTGTTGRRRLPNLAFSTLQIPKVPLSTQIRIAEKAMEMKQLAKKLEQESLDAVTQAKLSMERMISADQYTA